MPTRNITLGSFAPGVNNRLEPTQLDFKTPDGKPAHYLADAANVTLNDKGYAKRREGQTRVGPVVVSGSAHSLWADSRSAFMVSDGTLSSMVMSNDGLSANFSAVRGGIVNAALSYARGADGDVYWSNGQIIRRVRNGDNADRPIAPPTALLTPAGETLTTGALRAGRYLVCTTVQSIDGEGPASQVVAVDLPDNGCINIASGDGVAVLNVYMSAPDGDILTLQGAGANFDVLIYSANGRRCPTINRALMPAGQIVRFYNGSMLVAVGNMLYVSDPYNYGICTPSKGWFPFPAIITMIEPVENGVYIATDQTYFINDIFKDDLKDVLPYGAVPGSSVHSPEDKKVYWMTPRGLVVGDQNGVAKNLQEDTLDFGDATYGASLYRERDGASHVVTSRANSQQATAAAHSWMDAEIIRKGTVL